MLLTTAFVFYLLLCVAFAACLCAPILTYLILAGISTNLHLLHSWIHFVCGSIPSHCLLLFLIEAMNSNLNLISLFCSFYIRTLFFNPVIPSSEFASQLTLLHRIYERGMYFPLIFSCLYDLNYNDFVYHTLCPYFQANWDHLKLDNFTSLQGDCV